MAYFVRQIGNRHYIVHQYKDVDGRWRQTSERISDRDLKHIETTIAEKRKFEQELVEMPCWNPYCSNTVTMTPIQKRDFLISFVKKYDKVVLPFCCNECREKTMKMIEEGKNDT